MSRIITVLQAERKLTKTFYADGKAEPYPLIRDFTSLRVAYNTIEDLLEVITVTADSGGCLLKGHLTRDIENESRAGLSDANASTDWLVLDYDSDGGFDSIEELLSEIDPVLSETDYIFQHSASSGINGASGIRGHVFILLTEPVAPLILKQWVRKINLTSSKFRSRIKLSRNAMALCFALDTTVNQNDKLIYICPPVLIGMEDPVKKRFELHKRYRRTYSFESVISAEFNKTKELELIRALQDQAGIAAKTPKYTTAGDIEILLNPGECAVTGVRKGNPYTRINLNGGDSWAYWYYTDNPEILYNYKGEPAVYLKDVAPLYYQQVQQAESAKSVRPFVFRDVQRDTYYNALYDESVGHIIMCQPVNRRQTLGDFMIQRGSPAPKVIPDWDMMFDPTNKLTVDFQNKRLNTFAPTKYMTATPNPAISYHDFPTIRKVLQHICVEEPVYEHFCKWLAHIVQFRTKTQTAWLFSGTEGCVAGDTVLHLTRGKRHAGADRPRTIKDLYEKWVGISPRPFDRSIGPTKMTACKDELTIGYHEVHDIYRSGIKPVWRLTTSSGRSIKATAEHPFMRSDKSFTPMKDLAIGDEVAVQGDRSAPLRCKGRNRSRKTIHSVQFHPHAWRHVINGKDYKRIHYSRLVLEAELNQLSVDELIRIIRFDKDAASNLLYISPDFIVHHKDEDPSNDAVENLVLIDKENHDRHHAKSVGLGKHPVNFEQVISVEYVGEEMTYDVTMKAPYHNYVANGFVVSNTGKGVMFEHIVKKIIGHQHCALINQDNLEDQFNSYIEGNIITYVDEGDIETSKAAEKVMAKLRSTITESVLPVRKMRQNVILVPNFTNIIVATNRSAAIKLQQGDRRWNVAPRQHKKIELCHDEIFINIPRELMAFSQYLHALEIDRTSCISLIESDTRDALMELSRTVAEEFFEAVKDGDLDFFAERLQETVPIPEDGYISYATVVQKWMQNAVDGVTTAASVDELVTVYRYISGNSGITSKRFGHLSSRYELKPAQRRIRGIQRRVYDLEFKDRGYEIWLQRNKKAGIKVVLNSPQGADEEVSSNG